VKSAKEDVQQKVRSATTQRKQPEISQEEEEILRKAQIYLLFTAKRPMFWNVAAIREVKSDADTRCWIIAVHLRVLLPGMRAIWATSVSMASNSRN
jgi:hypothetical protein